MLALQHEERPIQNTGGLEHFLFVESAALAYDARPRRDVVSNTIVQALPLLDNAYWAQANVIRHTLDYRERQRLRSTGLSYQQNLQGVIAKVTPALTSALQQFENKKWVLIAKDRNGYYRLIGSKEHPLEFSYQSNSGRSPQQRNEVSFSFEGEQTHSAYFVAGSVVAGFGDIPTLNEPSPQHTERVTEDGIYIRILE